MTRHGRDCPDRCSLCRGVVPRRVDQFGKDLTVDGVPAGRQLDVESQQLRDRFMHRVRRRR